MKCFLFVLLIFNLGHAGLDQTLASVKKTFSDGASPVAVIAITIAALVIIAIAVYNEIRKSIAREKQRAKVSWGAFNSSSKEKGLLSAEIEILTEVLQKTKYPNAELILDSSQAFENAVEMFYKINRGARNIDSYKLDLIKELRHKLGYFPLPVETPFLSTRQFSPSARIMIELIDKGMAVNTNVSFVNEEKWGVLNNFDKSIKVQKDTPVRLIITRAGDAEYTIECKIFDVQDNEIIINHTRRLHRKQLRSWVRIDVNLPVVAKLVSTPNNEEVENLIIEGRIVDLSGGGLAMVLPHHFVVGSVVAASFVVNGMPMEDVQAKIVRVSVIGDATDPKYNHSVSFVDERKELQEKIVRYVFDKQRQDLQWK